MKDALQKELDRYLREAPPHRSEILAGRFYDSPLVGCASPANPLFEQFKTLIGPDHFSPAEAFELAFPGGGQGVRSVLSLVFPIAEPIRRANAAEREWGAPAWTLLRSFGDGAFLEHLRDHLVGWFARQGRRAAAPSALEAFRIRRGASGPTSNWSERHVAYAAGLGTFGVNDGFISERGMAVRLLSFVTDAELEPDPIQVAGVYGNCLFASQGTCGACFKRCPVGAISPQGHDKVACWRQCYGEASQAKAAAYGGIPALGNGCGLCQTGVPCEARNPARRPATKARPDGKPQPRP